MPGGHQANTPGTSLLQRDRIACQVCEAVSQFLLCHRGPPSPVSQQGASGPSSSCRRHYCPQHQQDGAQGNYAWRFDYCCVPPLLSSLRHGNPTLLWLPTRNNARQVNKAARQGLPCYVVAAAARKVNEEGHQGLTRGGVTTDVRRRCHLHYNLTILRYCGCQLTATIPSLSSPVTY